MKRVLPLVFVFLILPVAQAQTQKISQAYERRLVRQVESVFSSAGAAEELPRPVCATPIMLEVRANWDRLSVATRKILQTYVTRPTFSYPEQTYDTPGDPERHFKIHYVTEGDNSVYQPQTDANSNGVPDWVETLGEVLEHVWVAEIEKLEYRRPPSDILNPDTADNGGDGKYDIYLMNLTTPPDVYLGYTQGEYFISPTSGSATSYIVLDNDYLGYGSQHSQLEWLQVTAAHEFFHAVQMGYDGAEYEIGPQSIKPYWMEMSAVWMEEMVYDGIDDYLGYLPEFFSEPWLSLKAFESLSDLHPYGSCIWPMFLQERLEDTTVIRDIWDRCGEVPGNNALDYPDGKAATDVALEARGTTFEEAFREFTVWNYFTGDRSRTELYYSEGDMFPEAKVDDLHYHTTYPAFRPSGPNHPHNLGSNYVVFVPDPQLREGGLRIEFTGDGGDFNLSAVGYKSFPHMPWASPFIGVAKVYDWSSYNEVIMIPAVVTRSPDTYFVYQYQAFHDSSLTEEPAQHLTDKILQSYPNPFVIHTESDRTFFPFILYSPSRIRIDIFTLGGEKIRTVIPKRDLILSSGEYTEELVLRELKLFWDGTNEQGEYVSSGVYTYLFRTDRTSEVKKMAVIR